MGYNVKDRLNLSITFNGKEFPLRQNTVGYVHMVESSRLALPMLSLQLTDATKFMVKNNLLQDGTQIVIIVGIGKEKTTYNFRLFNHKEDKTSAAPKYVIWGYLDCPTYWTQSVVAPYRGTSDGVLSQIAGECGMKYTGTSTADNQSWMPQNRVYKDFANFVSQYGYISDSSCMQLGVTLAQELRYRNVSEFQSAKIQEEYVTGKEGTSSTKNMVTDYGVVNRSGFFNSVSGYADKRVQQSHSGTTKIEEKIDVPKNSTYLSMNSDIQGRTTQGSVRFAPVDAGNVHENSARAIYQNKRLANLFSFGLEIVTPRSTTAQILDVVRTVVTTPNVTSLASLSGEYLVVTKVVYIRGLDYYEKFELMRHGLNSDGGQQATNQVS